MNYRPLLTALMAWLPAALHAAPFTNESAAELASNLDANSDGLADLVLIDKATGVRQLAVQQPDGSFAWAEPRSTGIDGVTALTAGRFSAGSSNDGIAVAAPGWNRVHVLPNPASAETQIIAAAPGIGPNLVVALDITGDPALDDLAIATCWNNPPDASRLGASAWDGATANHLLDAAEAGPLTHGNRARLAAAAPWLLGMLRPAGASSEFITRIPGAVGFTAGPAVAGLPLAASWAWGEFDTSGYSQFLFYAAGSNILWVRPVEENTPGDFTFGSGAAFDLGQPIQLVCVLPQTAGALLLVIFGDGSTAGIYDFDGATAPVLRQALSAPPGALFSLAGPLGAGNLLLLHGPAGGAGVSTAWQRWNLDGAQHSLVAQGALPGFTPATGRGNVLVYENDPALIPDSLPVQILQAGEWSVSAAIATNNLGVTAEYFGGATSGLGTPAETGFSGRFVEKVIVVNQASAVSSIACVGPPLGSPAGDLAFNPPAGVYQPGAAGLAVRITATPDAPVYFRTDPSQPWTLYSAINPPSISITTTFTAYANDGSPTPIRSATYTIAAAPALASAPQTDANGDGLGDAWAAAFGITDPLDDPDGDGANNLAEFNAGTDPLDPASKPAAADLSNAWLVARPPGPTAPAGTLCDIVWPAGLTGVVLETTTDLAQPQSWLPAPGDITTSGDEQIYHHPATPGESRRFFRLRAAP